jgi:hypothetical protein
MALVPFKYKPLVNRDEYIPAKNRLEQIVKNANLTTGDGYISVWSKIYYYWIPNSVRPV